MKVEVDRKEATYARRWGRIGYVLREHQLGVMGFYGGAEKDWGELAEAVRARLRELFDAYPEAGMVRCPSCQQNELGKESAHLRLCLACGAVYREIDGALSVIAGSIS